MARSGKPLLITTLNPTHPRDGANRRKKMIKFPEIQIADALNCNETDLTFDKDQYFAGDNACFVELGYESFDCFFGSNGL